MKYVLWYVNDPSIPKDAKGNQENQRYKEFTSSWSRVWFILTDKTARASVRADRYQLIDVKK